MQPVWENMAQQLANNSLFWISFVRNVWGFGPTTTKYYYNIKNDKKTTTKNRGKGSDGQ